EHALSNDALSQDTHTARRLSLEVDRLKLCAQSMLAPSHSTATIRAAVFPSHRSIVGGGMRRRPHSCRAASHSASRRAATSRLVPALQVIGRSVLGRTVKHGMPR